MPIKIGFDASEAYAVNGFLKQMALQIGTPQHVGPVLKWVHQELSDAFTAHMSAVAPVNPSEFHHVYEWDAIGDPKQQLWRDVLIGGGANRVATFEWLASKTIVPVVHDDAMGHVKEIHVFTWKAPVMEYNTNITISPKRSQYLVYFTGPPGPYTDEQLHIVKGQSITVQYPGGAAAHGAFTKEYVAWWAGMGAESEFNQKLNRLLTQDLASMPLASVSGKFKAGTRSRQKSFGLTVMADAQAAEDYGRLKANEWLDSRDRNYIDAARAREAIMYGD